MTRGFADWIGRTVQREIVLEPWPAEALAAALGIEGDFRAGAVLPPFWHHLYGLDAVTVDQTGADGHRARGQFLPPVPLPRRMWAGGRLRFGGRLGFGDTVVRRSTVRSVSEKVGRSGPLVFVLVEHELVGPSGRVLEEHDVVYRDAGGPSGDGEPLAQKPLREKVWQPDEVMLFRYSALTYNGHRIHYDHRYVTEIEGYPGLIVHGPLLATLMLNLLRDAEKSELIERFAFRALRPVFVNRALRAVVLQDNALERTLGIVDADDRLAMTGVANLRG